jgi:hypothetical protein
MHQLTIATDTATSTTPHDDFADAHRALISHVIAQDLYLHASWPTPRTAVTFKLVSLDPAGRQPHITGTATIEPAPAKPVMGPYYSAEAALRWIADRTATWRHGCDTDPGVRHPLAVLTAAHAEARYTFTAGTIYNEAADLADVAITDVPRPRQNTFEILRDSAITAGRNGSITTAAELADAVQAQLTADITAHQTAALIWYYALILWGVNSS